MKIEFKKIPKSGIDFEISDDRCKLSGKCMKIRNNLVKCTGNVSGSFIHICDRCGEDFVAKLNRNIEVYASSGIYEDERFLDVMEFFDGYVDFDEMLQNEIESYKSEYLYCDECKDIN